MARVGCDVGAAGADAGRSAASLSLIRAAARYSPRAVFRGDLVCALHRYALVAGALPRVGLAGGETCRRRLEECNGAACSSRRSLSCNGVVRAERLDWSRVIVDASLVEAKKGARRSRARSAARRQPLPPNRRREAGCRSPSCWRPATRTSSRYLLPLLDELARAGIHPGELWADRGYASRAHEASARAPRRSSSRISQPRRARPAPPPRHPNPRGLARQTAPPQNTPTRRPATAGRSNAPTPR